MQLRLPPELHGVIAIPDVNEAEVILQRALRWHGCDEEVTFRLIDQLRDHKIVVMVSKVTRKVLVSTGAEPRGLRCLYRIG
jgi:hypothetical protein